MDRSAQLVATAAGTGAALGDAADAVATAIGGWASVGSAVMCVREMRREEPRWERAIAHGAIGGVFLGALFLLLEMIDA